MMTRTSYIRQDETRSVIDQTLSWIFAVLATRNNSSRVDARVALLQHITLFPWKPLFPLVTCRYGFDSEL